MTATVSEMCGGKQVKIDIVEIKQPETDAQLVAEGVAMQLERRISFRRAMKRALQTAMDFGADGIRIRCAGRLGGADIALVVTLHAVTDAKAVLKSAPYVFDTTGKVAGAHSL
jgi:ribosomal protein S3